MAVSPQIQTQAAVIRAKIASTPALDEDQKNRLFELVSLTEVATNGISYEEKIQKMTEAMYSLTISQIEFITHINKTVVDSLNESSKKIENLINTTQQTIQTTIANATLSRCSSCKAMKHAEDIEREDEKRQIIEQMGGKIDGNGHIIINDGSHISVSDTNTITNTTSNSSNSIKIDWIEFWQKTLSTVLTQPWMWLVLAVAALSPYGVNLINALKELF